MAGLAAEQADELLGEIEFNGDDLPVPRDQAEQRDSWEDGQAESEEQAKTKSDPWKWARFGTVHDVAGLFDVHFKTVEDWRRKLGLPFVRIGGVLRYMLSDVLAWASARKEGI